jgi:uncharacterized protein YxeA
MSLIVSLTNRVLLAVTVIFAVILGTFAVSLVQDDWADAANSLVKHHEKHVRTAQGPQEHCQSL